MPDDLRELVTYDQVETWFRVLALLAPLVGAAIGAVVGVKTRHVLPALARGLAWGLLGTANWLLWRMYNALTDRLGLDSIKNFLVNLAIFVGLGLTAGAMHRIVASRRPRDEGAAASTERTHDGS
jgi:hypothetical protein